MPCRSESRVVGEGDAIPVLEADEPGHGVGAGAVHADLAVVIDGHEREGRIDLRVHDGDVELVDRVDRLPVVHGGAAERIDAELEAGAADGLHVDDVAQIVDVGQDEIFLVRRLAASRAAANGTRLTPALPSRSSSLARSSIHCVTSVSAGPPCGGLYLKPPSSGGLCDGRDDDAVGEMLGCARGCGRGSRAR